MESKASSSAADEASKKGEDSAPKKAQKNVSKRNKLSITGVLAAQEQKRALQQIELNVSVSSSGIVEVNRLTAERSEKTEKTENEAPEAKQKKKKHKKKRQGAKNKDKDSSSDNSQKEVAKKAEEQRKPEEALIKAPMPVESPLQKVTGKRNGRFSEASMSISSDDPFKSLDTNNSADNWHQLSTDSLRREDSSDRLSIKSRDSISEPSLDGGNDQQVRKRPRKVITKPTPDHAALPKIIIPKAKSPQKDMDAQSMKGNRVKSLKTDNTQLYPSPPKEAPPARKSRRGLESDSCSTLSIDEPPKAEVRRTNDSFNEDSTSLHEPNQTPPRRARRSPLHLIAGKATTSGDSVSADEKPIETESDSSEEDQTNLTKFARNGPFFSESASSSEKPSKRNNRPPPLQIDSKPHSREARKINDELEKRNKNTPKEIFVLHSDIKCLTKKGNFTPPSWDIVVQKLEDPSDAKYIHQMQTLYSMSSILNGLKKL